MHPFGQTSKLLEQLGGMSVEELQILFGGYLTTLRNAAQCGTLPTRSEFTKFLGMDDSGVKAFNLQTITIPEATVTFDQRLTDGQYEHVNSCIDRTLSVFSGPRSLTLIHFNKRRTSTLVKAWADEYHYELARIDDLLALACDPTHRDLQLGYKIIALGSTTRHCGDFYSPYLSHVNGERKLDLKTCNGAFEEDWHFLMHYKKVAA